MSQVYPGFRIRLLSISVLISIFPGNLELNLVDVSSSEDVCDGVRLLLVLLLLLQEKCLLSSLFLLSLLLEKKLLLSSLFFSLLLQKELLLSKFLLPLLLSEFLLNSQFLLFSS